MPESQPGRAKRSGVGKPIYLDYQATTPLDPRVLDAMLPHLSGRVGNPHSTGHAHGREAMRAVEEARASVAALIGAAPAEVVFTSGAKARLRGADGRLYDLRAGVPADVIIPLRPRTALDYALEPLFASMRSSFGEH